MHYMKRIIKEYLEWKGTYAPRASYNYRIWLNRFTEVCGDKKVEQYKVTDLIRYRKWLEMRFSPCSVTFAIIVMKNFLQYCKMCNYSCLSPTLIKLPRMTAKSHRAISEEEFKRMVGIIPINEYKSLRDVIIIRMLWDTGVRVSELIDIDITQIDGRKHSMVIQTKKTGKMRIIVWSEETHELLMRYLPIRSELRHLNRTSALFVGQNKGGGWSARLTSRSIQRIVKFYATQSGLKEKVSPHSFRHGWAHKRRDQNAPLAFIQRGLGHINPVSTFIYEQYNDKEFERNANTYLKTA